MRDKLNKPVVLVGMMGSGKSTVGRKLAKKLNLRFYDSDKVIEEREGLSVVDIFDFRGEDYFRQKEEETITEILRYGTIILSTGGSSFINPNIREIIKEKAISVWLSTDLETLIERVSRRNTRPELNNGDKRKIMENLVNERYPIFSMADIKVESGDLDTYFIVENIMHLLQKYENKSNL